MLVLLSSGVTIDATGEDLVERACAAEAHFHDDESEATYARVRKLTEIVGRLVARLDADAQLDVVNSWAFKRAS